MHLSDFSINKILTDNCVVLVEIIDLHRPKVPNVIQKTFAVQYQGVRVDFIQEFPNWLKHAVAKSSTKASLGGMLNRVSRRGQADVNTCVGVSGTKRDRGHSWDNIFYVVEAKGAKQSVALQVLLTESNRRND